MRTYSLTLPGFSSNHQRYNSNPDMLSSVDVVAPYKSCHALHDRIASLSQLRSATISRK